MEGLGKTKLWGSEVDMINAVNSVLLLSLFMAPAEEIKPQQPVKLTVVLRGADTDADVEVLTKALRSVKGVKIITDSISEGHRRFNNRFTTPIVITMPTSLGDDDANVGALATAVSEAKTKDREKFPPGVNLILFTDDALNEGSISALRSSLSRVNGVDVNRPGGPGGSLKDGWCWIRLENAGGAMLKEIEEKARTSGLKYRRLQHEQIE